MSWISSVAVRKTIRACLAALFLAASASSAKTAPPLVGDMVKFVPSDGGRIAPDTPFISAAGEPIKLESYRGKTVLLNFWATWCAPCIKELPALDRLSTELGGDRFEVLLVSIDRGGFISSSLSLKSLVSATLHQRQTKKPSFCGPSRRLACQLPS